MMRIGKMVLDTDNLSVADITTIITELKKVRECKQEARAFGQNFQAMLNNMKDQGYTFCNKHTGEVLNAGDWLVFCEELGTIEGWD